MVPFNGTSTTLRFRVIGSQGGLPLPLTQPHNWVDAVLLAVDLNSPGFDSMIYYTHRFGKIVRQPLYQNESVILVFHNERVFRQGSDPARESIELAIEATRKRIEMLRPEDQRYQRSYHHLVYNDQELVPEVFFNDIARMILSYPSPAPDTGQAIQKLPFLCRHNPCAAGMPSLAVNSSEPYWRPFEGERRF